MFYSLFLETFLFFSLHLTFPTYTHPNSAQPHQSPGTCGSQAGFRKVALI